MSAWSQFLFSKSKYYLLPSLSSDDETSESDEKEGTGTQDNQTRSYPTTYSIFGCILCVILNIIVFRLGQRTVDGNVNMRDLQTKSTQQPRRPTQYKGLDK